MSNPYFPAAGACALACLFIAAIIRTSRAPRAARAVMPYAACLLVAALAGAAAWELASPVEACTAALSVIAIGSMVISAIPAR